MKQIFKLREKLWVSLIIIAFAVLLVTPQLFTRKVILGSDSIFHYNRFYEAAMQLNHEVALVILELLPQLFPPLQDLLIVSTNYSALFLMLSLICALTSL